MRIEQAYISPALSHFKDEFLECWNLKDYDNPEEPALFWALYPDWDGELKCEKDYSPDVDTYNNHNNFKVLIAGGVEWTRGMFDLIDTKNINLVAVDEIEIEYEGEPFQIGFNSRYLLDVMSVLESKNVKLECKNSMSPTIIKSPDDESFLSVIMPLRVEW